MLSIFFPFLLGERKTMGQKMTNAKKLSKIFGQKTFTNKTVRCLTLIIIISQNHEVTIKKLWDLGRKGRFFEIFQFFGPELSKIVLKIPIFGANKLKEKKKPRW